MLELCRKAVEMIKAYPRLLLPLAVSTFSYYWFEHLQRFLYYKVVDWASTSDSVLGFQSTTQDLSNPNVRRALLMLVPVSLLLRLFSFSIYVGAFVVTARLVRSMVLGAAPDWAAAVSDLQSRFLRSGLFSLALFSLGALSALGAAFLLGVSPHFERVQSQIGTINAAKIVILPFFALVSWIMVPFGFRLIASEPGQPISQQHKRFGRIGAIVVIAIYMLCSYLIATATPLINRIFQSEIWIRGYLVWPSISILGELPLAFLWVFLAVIIFEDLEPLEIPSPS